MISVIVPVYKVEQYLRECVDSILAQSYTDFELILVDDGSPDRCGEICDAYAKQDPRVRVIHQENQGLSGARNSGMDIARGEYITFVDSDDLVSPEYLRILSDTLQETGADISVGLKYVFQDQSLSELLDGEAVDVPEAVAMSGRDACISIYEGKTEVTINACSKLFRASLLEDLRFPEGRIHEDQAFTPIACYKAEYVASVDYPIYFYRSREDSITQDHFSIKRYDDLWAIDQCLTLFESLGEKEIVSTAKAKRKKLQCTYSIYAQAAKVVIPGRYYVNRWYSLFYLKKYVSQNKFEYLLSITSRRALFLYVHWRRIVEGLQKSL